MPKLPEPTEARNMSRRALASLALYRLLTTVSSKGIELEGELPFCSRLNELFIIDRRAHLIYHECSDQASGGMYCYLFLPPPFYKQMLAGRISLQNHLIFLMQFEEKRVNLPAP
ncbi:hypothetical protein V6N12_076009 [Hibiscus sabdariffa]|uniref:Uncharacterized protein n=1 Tax=Hibiscus sabdariffa TaxID=183260 RepID=A0ABR2AY54_9ROSI